MYPRRTVVAGPDHLPAGLSPREPEVYTALAKGLTIGKIARQLGVSQDTVYTHCRRMCLKLGCTGTRELMLHALRSQRN